MQTSQHAYILSVVCADTRTTPPAMDFANVAAAYIRSRTAGKKVATGLFFALLHFERAYVRKR